MLSLCLLASFGWGVSVSSMVPDALIEVPFSSCLPMSLLSNSKTTFLNGWEPVKGTMSASSPYQFTNIASLNYYTNAKFTAKDSEGGAWRKNGRFELLTTETQVAIGAMYTAPVTGLVDLSMASFSGVRQLATGSASQERIVVNNVVYYGYFSVADHTKRYYAKVGGIVSEQPVGGWFRYDEASESMKAAGMVQDTLAMAYPTAPFSYRFCIMLNGAIIWPSDGIPWLCEGGMVDHTTQQATEDLLDYLQQAEELPKEIYLEAGDQLAFVATCEEESNRYLVLQPVVRYKDTFSPICVEAGISVNDKFAVDYYLQADASASRVGVFCNGEFLNGILQADGRYRVTIDNIAAKELGDNIIITPVQTIHERDIAGHQIGISPAALLKKYVVNDRDDVTSNLAIAILNYGAAAQRYFGYHDDFLVNADLTVEQREIIYQKNYQSVAAVTGAADCVALPKGMSLLLEDAIAFRLYVNGEDADGCYAQIASNDTFAVATTAHLQLFSEAEKAYIATFYGVIPTAWDNVYYFRVVDAKGNVVSPVITYSVTSYIVRMLGQEHAAEEASKHTLLLTSMLALHEAAQAYEQI